MFARFSKISETASNLWSLFRCYILGISSIHLLSRKLLNNCMFHTRYWICTKMKAQSLPETPQNRPLTLMVLRGIIGICMWQHQERSCSLVKMFLESFMGGKAPPLDFKGFIRHHQNFLDQGNHITMGWRCKQPDKGKDCRKCWVLEVDGREGRLLAWTGNRDQAMAVFRDHSKKSSRVML